MQVNSIQSNQNFGMAMRVDKNAIELLSKKLGSQKNFDKFEKLVIAQAENPFNVRIDLANKKLSGCVANGCTYFKYHEKGLFQSTIKWIEKMCKDADNQLKKLELQKSLESILNK